MDSSVYRHRRAASSDRFISLYSLSPSSDTGFGSESGNGDDELHESEVFWTGDSRESNPHHRLVKPGYQSHCLVDHATSGIPAVLPKVDRPILSVKDSISSSSARVSPAIPRPPQIEREYSQSVPCRNLNRSSPMKVPAVSKGRNRESVEIGDENEELEMLPPHEIVTRGSGVSPRTTFSVLEGKGRTLKGRDLRQVRNAIWRKTGFLD